MRLSGLDCARAGLPQLEALELDLLVLGTKIDDAVECLAAGVGDLQTMPLDANAEKIASTARVPHAANHVERVLLGMRTQAALDRIAFFPRRILDDGESQANAAGRDVHQL